MVIIFVKLQRWKAWYRLAVRRVTCVYDCVMQEKKALGWVKGARISIRN